MEKHTCLSVFKFKFQCTSTSYPAVTMTCAAFRQILTFRIVKVNLSLLMTSGSTKQMTNLRVPLKLSDGRAQWQNPCDTKRLLFSARDLSRI